MNFRLAQLEPVDWSRSQGDLENENNEEMFESPIFNVFYSFHTSFQKNSKLKISSVLCLFSE